MFGVTQPALNGSLRVTRAIRCTVLPRLTIALLMAASLPAFTGDDPYPVLDHHTFVHDGVMREFFVHVPEGHEHRLPVVIALHGYNSTATGFAAYHDLGAHADEHGYLVVIPQGTHFAHRAAGQAYRVTSWNMLGHAGPDSDSSNQCLPDATRYPCPPNCAHCDRCTWASCGDDLGFFETLLDVVGSRYDTDPGRYYLLGVSNGGMMALALGCALPERFAAIAPIIAQLPAGAGCAPPSPLPMLHLSAGRDETVPPDGGPASDGFVYQSAQETVVQWARAMACQEGPVDWQSAPGTALQLNCSAFTDCAGGSQEVVMCSDPDEAHLWPGRRPGGPWPTCVTSQQSEAMPEQSPCAPRSDDGPHLGLDLIWEFFSRFERKPGLRFSTSDSGTR